MRRICSGFMGFVLGGFVLAVSMAEAAGDPENGARVFRACEACHSLEPGRNMTGPSLANIWGRKAATVEGFHRYSEALKSSDIVWNADTLDAWIKNPNALVPGNRMPFPGMKDPQARADLVAYLKDVSSAGSGGQAKHGGGMGGMMGGGMMRGPTLQDLKTVDPDRQVTAIRYCGDTYHVTTAAGETIPFWEFNLRFKTDSSDKGPAKGKPVLTRAGMMGDRASMIFSDPSEIGAIVEKKC